MSTRVGLCERVADDFAFGSFHVHYAVGLEPRREEYRLRYAAFVEEHHWESADACHGRLETDEFDRFSCSALLVDSVTGNAAACQRLILPEYLPDGLRTNVEREHRPLPSGPSVDFSKLDRSNWAEASRLAIAPPYRWGSAKTSIPALIAVSYASLALALALDRSVVFTISDPRTARLTRRMRFSMRQVGQLVDFHGARAVFQIEVAEVLASVPGCWQALVTRLTEDARSAASTRAIHRRMVLHAA